jgi:hypothetical protein
VDTYLELYLANGTFATFNDDIDGNTTDSRIVFTTTLGGWFAIFATTFEPAVTGTYTLTVAQVGVGLATPPTVPPASAAGHVSPDAKVGRSAFPIRRLPRRMQH